MATSSKPEKTAEPLRGEKGVAHPADSLRVAIDRLTTLRTAIGFVAASRDTIIQAWGFKSMSGHAGRQLGLMTHFDLLERTGKGSLKISELGRSILIPTSEKERSAAIAIAALRPTLYAKVLQNHKGHSLPTMLANLLVREYGVFPSSAEDASKAFRETMEFAGLLRNGLLYDEPLQEEDGAASNPKDDHQVEESSDVDGKHAPAKSVGLSPIQGTQAYTIPLDHTGRLATLQMPLPVSGSDMRAVSAWVKYMTDNFFAAKEGETKPSNTSGN